MRKEVSKGEHDKGKIRHREARLRTRVHRKGGSRIEPLPRGIKRPEPTADYRSMTKEEFINELMLKDIEVAHAKKGYSVKGVERRSNSFL